MKKHFLLISAAITLLFAQCSKSDVGGVTGSNLNNRSVGTSANDFLSGARYQAVHIEVDYMPGYLPDAAALNNLVGFLNSFLNKPGGISITLGQIPASGKSNLLLTDVIATETSQRSVFTAGNTLGVYVLYTDAPYNEANTLGLAYRNTSMVVFAKTLHTNSGGINQPSRTKLESITTQHEFGHLLGLVDLGTPMVTNHKYSSSNHCINSACLMYYQTTVGVVGGVLVSGPIPELDADCRNDLRANGGK